MEHKYFDELSRHLVDNSDYAIGNESKICHMNNYLTEHHKLTPIDRANIIESYYYNVIGIFNFGIRDMINLLTGAKYY